MKEHDLIKYTRFYQTLLEIDDWARKRCDELVTRGLVDVNYNNIANNRSFSFGTHEWGHFYRSQANRCLYMSLL